jgi:TPR repeat protein
VCSAALIAGLVGCSRAPAGRHNPIEDPLAEAFDGDVAAQYEVGVRIAATPASAPDYAQAARWLRLAADKGHIGAQASLGFMYHRGQGVPRNDVEAIKWLTLATTQSSAEHDAYALWREYVARQMTQGDVAEGERLARAWQRQ